MPNVSLAKFSGTESDVVPFLKKFLNDLEEQLQSISSVVINSNPTKAKKSSGSKDLSIDFQSNGTTIALRIQNPNKTFFEIFLNTDLNGFKPLQQKAGAPSTVHFPESGDWGYYVDVAGPTYYLVRNFAGSIKKVALT